MAKLKAPLMSLGASGALGGALVYFPWKGLNVVREYVIPTNPKSALQTIQRGYLTAVVAAIHAAEALAAFPLAELDKIAFAQWGLNWKDPRTWFNVICKNWLDQRVADLRSAIYHGAVITAGDTQVYVWTHWTKDGANNITDGAWWYGKTRTAMVNSWTPDFGADNCDATITGLTNGQKYYFQFRPTAHADFVGSRSGIFSAIPKA